MTREPIWMPVADWVAEHDSWVFVPTAMTLLWHFGVVAFLLALVMTLTSALAAQNHAWEGR